MARTAPVRSPADGARPGSMNHCTRMPDSRAWCSEPTARAFSGSACGSMPCSSEAAAHGDHRAAFGRYERQLRGYIAGGQKQAAGGQAFLAPATWNKIRQRNLFFKILPYLPIKGLISRAATKTATAITVPDYGPVPR
jgi:hypothetical protein